MACPADYAFGAVLPSGDQTGCRDFDFRIVFEDAFLTLAPSLVVLPVVALRIRSLFQQPKLLGWPWIFLVKLALFSVLAILQLAVLGLHASGNGHHTSNVTVPAYAFLFVSTIGFASLSALEHFSSPRPSVIIQAFLSLTLLFDAAVLRTQWLLPTQHTMAALLSTAFFFKFGLLVAESLPKDTHLLPDKGNSLSPEDKAGFFSRSFFLWLNPLFLRGYSSKLSEADLFYMEDDLTASKLAQDLDAAWEKTKPTRRRRLGLALMRTFLGQILIVHLPRLALVGFAIAQPVLVQSALSYITYHTFKPVQFGYGLIGAFALVYTCVAVSTAWYQHQTNRLLVMIRGSLIGVIIKHRLRLPASEEDGSSGAVSLMGADVERAIQTLQWSLNIVPNVVQVGLGLWILEMHLGAVCVAPTVVAVVCSIIAGNVGKRTPARQRRWMEAIQKRIKVTAKAVSEIKAIKMSGLTDTVTEQIQGLRLSEIEEQKAFRRLQITNIAVGNGPSMITSAVTFAAFAIQQRLSSGRQLDVVSAYSSLSLLSILVNPIAELVMATTNLGSALGCLDRIQEFLQRESQQDRRILLPSVAVRSGDDSNNGHDTTVTELQPVGDQSLRFHPHSRGPIICIKDGTFGWGPEPTRAVLSAINLEILPSTRTIITGPVGSGKSTLLKSLLGETCIISGSVECISPKQTAYCDQEPWILNISLKQNILGISSYDEDRYQAVVEACQLQHDFVLLPDGDSTLAGSQGLSLSGGQKQRIALARAAYSEKRLIIIDDSFSGLDAATSLNCFHALLGQEGLCHKDGRTVVFATHNVKWFSYADDIIVLDEGGQISGRGDYQSLRKTDDYVQQLHRSREIQRDLIEDGRVILAESTEEPRRKSKTADVTVATSNSAEDSSQQQDSTRKQQAPRKKCGALNYYMSSLGFGAVWGFLILVVGLAGCNASRPLWLKYWVTAYEIQPDENAGKWIGIYVLFSVGSILFIALDTGYFLLLLVPRSAKNLHQKLLTATMSAPLSFMTLHDTGSILTRFTGDLNLTDLALPLSFLLGSERAAGVVAEVILTCLASGYLALSIPVLVPVLYMVQSVYLKTSRQLRVLELELKGPLFSNVISTFAGLVTIRAFSWTNAVEKENMALLDSGQRPYYLLFCVQRWLTLVLDLVTAGMATLLMGLAVALRDSIDPGFLGIALVSVMSFGSVVGELMVNWANLETSLGAISRIRNYVDDTPSETTNGGVVVVNEPPVGWPSAGELAFDNVSASYGSSSGTRHKVLDSVSLVIPAGAKVAICGRTGSGKSSLLALLVRLMDTDSGSITIDGVRLTDVAPDLIRRALVALPQDPLFLSGSVRLNLDPFALHDGADEPLRRVLDKTGLASVFADKGGLDKDLKLEWLSSGQRQLFCMARAMLRQSRILLLDEATSHLDVQTEKLINRLIQTEFRDWTVLVVTHLVRSVAEAGSGFDQVVVLANGRIVEQGSPTSLMQKHDSAFRELLNMHES